MTAYTGLPVLNIDLLGPDRFAVDVVGNAIDGGRNGVGEAISIGMSGGGLLTADLGDCRIVNEKQFEYVNFLGARLNGSFRFINVPIPTDWWGPFPIIGGRKTPFVTAIPQPDGALFTTEGGFSTGTVWGEVTEDAAVGAGIIKIKVYNARRDIRFSDWFSFKHDNKGWRAYRNWDVLDKSEAENPVYQLAIQPTLREAIAEGDRCEFARPMFAGKFKQGFTLPSQVEIFFVTRQSISFSEAF